MVAKLGICDIFVTLFRGLEEAGYCNQKMPIQEPLGTFYTYFESKEEIFQALVSYMSHRTRSWIAERVADAPDRLTAERKGLEAYIEFICQHKGIYRIISEAEFVANDAYREHYTSFANAYQKNLEEAGERGEIREGDYATWSWAIMGMAVILGMRFAEWDESMPASRIAETETGALTRRYPSSRMFLRITQATGLHDRKDSHDRGNVQ
jgi:AcrR family transcriptional regulator